MNAIKEDPASSQRSALHNAAEKGHIYIVYYLVSKGAVLSSDRLGKTALDLAEANGHQDTASFLKKHFKLIKEPDLEPILIKRNELNI